MKNNLRLNLAAGIIQPLIVLIVNYFVKQSIFSQLGQEYLGLQTVYGNFCDVLLFAYSGIGIAMLFRLYKPIEEGNEELLQSLFTFFDRVFRLVFIICMVLGVILSFLLINTVDVTMPAAEIIGGYILYLFSVLLYNRYLIYHYYIWANQKRYIGCFIWAIIDFAAMFAEIAVLTCLHSFILFLVCILIKNSLESLILVLYARKKYPCIRTTGRNLSSDERRNALTDVKDMIISRIGNLLLSSTDSIIISAVVNTVTAGFYSTYYFVTYGVEVILCSLFDSIMSRIGKAAASIEKSSLFHTYIKSCVLNLWIAAVTVSLFYNLVSDFITLWIGPEALLPQAALIIITVNLYMNAMRHTAMLYRQSAGLFAKVSNVILLRGVCNVILSIILGMIWGIAGVLIATTITDVLTVYWYEPYNVLKYFKKSFLYEIVYQLLGIGSAVTTLFITEKAASLIGGISWGSLLLKGTVTFAAGAVWMALLLLIGVKIVKHFRKVDISE